MRVSNEHSGDGNGIRPFPGEGQAGADRDFARPVHEDRSFPGTVDWARAEAQAEA